MIQLLYKTVPVIEEFRSFEDGGLADGMRCDSLGNIYVTRWGIGEIWKISPDGRLLRTIKTKGKNLTNVAFGGTDGKTIFVTVPDRGIIEYFRVEDPGIPLLNYHTMTDRADGPYLLVESVVRNFGLKLFGLVNNLGPPYRFGSVQLFGQVESTIFHTHKMHSLILNLRFILKHVKTFLKF